MSVSRLRGKTPTIVIPVSGQTVDVPPFWELEDLIATGLDREAALRVMAARRAALTLVGAAGAAEIHPFDLTPGQAMIAGHWQKREAGERRS